MDSFGFKDLEDVALKSTYNIEMGSKTIVAGETIAFFDRIQIANLQEVNQSIAAAGGFDNSPRVIWDTTKEIKFSFTQGVMSKEQLAILMNANLVEPTTTSTSVFMREYLESDKDGYVECKHTPTSNIFVYNKSTGASLTFTQSENKLLITPKYTEVIVDYDFTYSESTQFLKLGQKLISGYLSLEGKTRLKDDTTGQVVTGVLKIPRLKLMSDVSMRLGAQANPLVGSFNAIALPVGSRGSTYVSEFCLLSDDIYSDL